MEKRLLVAVTLSIVIMLTYPFFLAKISPPQIENNNQENILQQPDNKSVTVKYPKESHDKTSESRNESLKEAVLTPISVMKYDVIISTIGGSIQKLAIKDDKRLDIDLITEAIFDSGILAMEGNGQIKGLSSQQFEINKDTNTIFIEKDGLRIEKTIRFINDKYGFIASVSITNHSEIAQPVSYWITTGSNISKQETYESRYIEANVYYNDDKMKKFSGGNLKKNNELYEKDIKWLGLKNKYYSIICEPKFSPAGVFTKHIADNPVTGFIVEDENILPGQSKVYEFLFYVGPTEISELEKMDKSFSKALNFGFFTSISLILLGILKFFYSLFHNYGVSILLLTCCISLLLFPLSFKSLKSMRRLQELQPKIEKARAEYKDNPQKLNKEIMEIYRRYKVNPMGGCMPMFLQMPIFIALYQTLMRSVELKGASFLWIKDLSMPDAAFHMSFSLPFLGNSINILPILMIGAMIIQQKMSQFKTASVQTEQQKMMGAIMPVMFGVIFYNLPAGLVLYWLTNTVLSSALQFLLLRKT